MNIIGTATSQREFINRGIMQAYCNINPDKLFLIDNCKNPVQEFPQLADKIVQRYDSPQTHELMYQGKVENDNLIPLDEPLLKAFEPYFPTTLKMLERTCARFEDTDGRVRHIFTHLRYWNTIILRHKIDLFVHLDVPHEGYTYIIYALCKIHGVKTVFSRYAPVSSYSYIVNDMDVTMPELPAHFESLKEKYKDCSMDDIVLSDDFNELFIKQTGSDEGKNPWYMSTVNPDSLLSSQNIPARRKKINRKVKLRRLALMIPYRYEARKETVDNFDNTFNYFFDWNETALNSGFDFTKHKFIYFPLHLQPESTSCPAGGYYAYQELAVEMLSRAVPDDVYICVKENPKQNILSRDRQFVNRLAAMRNVKLVTSDTSTFELMSQCIAVATLTGTALMEGVFKGKPGIMFGEYIYKHMPMVYHVNSNEDCAKAVSDITSGNLSVPSFKELKIFFKAMEDLCHPATIHNIPAMEKLGVDVAAKNIENLFTTAIMQTMNR